MIARQPDVLADPLAPPTPERAHEPTTFGEHLADRVAAIGGSWSFIIGFSVFLLIWTASNALDGARAVDPFPFVFLNLILSLLAALQAPVIMMSQNRQATKDRLEARIDYATNQRTEAQLLKLSAEVAALHAELRAGQQG